MSDLTAEELYHLALDSSGRGDHEKAIINLKRCIDLDRNPHALYLLGAEYAEIGMYKNAFEFMSHATNIEPELWIAHYHAGLVQLILGDADQAETAWARLDVLGDSNPLVLFKNGLLLLERGSIKEGSALIRSGMAVNQEHPDINADMENVLKSVSDAATTPIDSTSNGAGDVVAAEPTASSDQSHLFLNAYRSRDK